jgi:hypothetical protein
MVNTLRVLYKPKELSETTTKKAIYLSNNGLGDNLISASAIRFLLNYYEEVRFICKDKYLDNVKLFFHPDENVKIITIHPDHEFEQCRQIITDSYAECDVFICGAHIQYLGSDIKHPKILEYQQFKRDNKKYDVSYDTINYLFLKWFYHDIKLDLSVYYENFRIDSTDESQRLYNLVKNYRIIFTQIECSHGQKLNIEGVKEKYIDDPSAIIVCTSQNLYNIKTHSEKHAICENFVFNKLVYYIDVIMEADEIYLMESCFTNIVLPLLKNRLLKAEPIRIIDRATSQNYSF